MRLATRLAAAAILGSGIALAQAGHDNLEVDRAFTRHAGQIVALGKPDDQGRVYSFRAKRLPAAGEFLRDELRGWRLTMLAGKRFSQAFEVLGNSGAEITVAPVDGPLNGVAVNDVFVIENIAIERQNPPSPQ
jgi:hypothetical protein